MRPKTLLRDKVGAGSLRGMDWERNRLLKTHQPTPLLPVNLTEIGGPTRLQVENTHGGQSIIVAQVGDSRVQLPVLQTHRCQQMARPHGLVIVNSCCDFPRHRFDSSRVALRREPHRLGADILELEASWQRDTAVQTAGCQGADGHSDDEHAPIRAVELLLNLGVKGGPVEHRFQGIDDMVINIHEALDHLGFDDIPKLRIATML